MKHVSRFSVFTHKNRDKAERNDKLITKCYNMCSTLDDKTTLYFSSALRRDLRHSFGAEAFSNIGAAHLKVITAPEVKKLNKMFKERACLTPVQVEELFMDISHRASVKLLAHNRLFTSETLTLALNDPLLPTEAQKHCMLVYLFARYIHQVIVSASARSLLTNPFIMLKFV